MLTATVRVGFSVGCAAGLLVAVVACTTAAGGEGRTAGTSSSEASASPSASAFSRLPSEQSATIPAPIDHTVVIVDENKPAASVLGNPDAPYINELAAEFSLAADYDAVAHPSLPNYLAITSGTTAGITDDCNPPGGSCEARVPEITGEITASGRTWKMYAEGMPFACDRENSGRYAVKHNPFLYYPSVTANASYCRAHVVPFGQLSQDIEHGLPDFAFITPDLCNDMHDCSVRVGDRWLSKQAGRILKSPAFTSENSLLVITWDEGDSQSNRVVTIFAGSAAKKGYQSTRAYNHYSLLHTIESAWGLAPLTGNDRDATVMSDLLRR